jgi:PadR family transcriptional regulator PadR
MLQQAILENELETMVGTSEETRKFQKELNAGTTALILLAVLSYADEPMYGYQIARLIESKSGYEAIIKQGALYPVLRALESSGLLESEIEPSVSGPPRRYYGITDSGRQLLEKWKEIWTRTEGLVNTILGGGE